MMDIELAWAAGFFDGEGHCGLRRNGKYGFIMITQHHSDETLHRFRAAVGLGNIYGKNNIWQYSVSNHPDTITVLSLLYPLLSSPKRKQADKVLNSTYKVHKYEKSEACLS